MVRYREQKKPFVSPPDRTVRSHKGRSAGLVRAWRMPGSWRGILSV